MRGAAEAKKRIETALYDLRRVRFQARQLLAACDKSLLAQEETVSLGFGPAVGGQPWPEDGRGKPEEIKR